MRDSRVSLVASGILTAEDAILDAERDCRDLRARVATLTRAVDAEVAESNRLRRALVEARSEIARLRSEPNPTPQGARDDD